MNNNLITQLAKQLKISVQQVKAVIELLENNATIPFIARYRKDQTGNLDEVSITVIRDQIELTQKIEKRREAIIESLVERGLFTDEIAEKLLACKSLCELEDTYLPLRPKRRTRASMAIDCGLKPLAEQLWCQDDSYVNLKQYIDPFKNIFEEEEVLEGARDIMAEWISEDIKVRNALRIIFTERSLLTSRLADKENAQAARFKDYFEWQEPLFRVPSHRFMAMQRGANLGILRLHALPDESNALTTLYKTVVKSHTYSANQVKLAAQSAYKRLITPSLEKEALKATKDKADLAAIEVFATNLRELLLAAPAGNKTILAIDPGFRSGCKCAVINPEGKLLSYQTIFPFDNANKAGKIIADFCKNHRVELIAVGNGTAGRETEAFLETLNLEIEVISTDESGASIYSAGEVARFEFPDLDLTIRSAISIGRRLQDPLSELVKLDPSSIGVGQYQHDVDQNLLKKKLDDVVISCVNAVGVDLNNASAQLLSYVSGLSIALARNIVNYRDENGPFKSRSELKKVPRLGEKAFEQCAGFLRIKNAKNPLDNTAVHPENYNLVKNFAKDLNCQIEKLINNQILCEKIDLKKYLDEECGELTLQTIINELLKPSRDPRPQFELFQFDSRVHKPADLEEGMVLGGIITNVTKFGAFVNIGVHQDGLVHISEIANHFIKDPTEVVKVRQKVQVKVLSVDLETNRINLSMRNI